MKASETVEIHDNPFAPPLWSSDAQRYRRAHRRFGKSPNIFKRWFNFNRRQSDSAWRKNFTWYGQDGRPVYSRIGRPPSGPWRNMPGRASSPSRPVRKPSKLLLAAATQAFRRKRPAGKKPAQATANAL